MHLIDAVLRRGESVFHEDLASDVSTELKRFAPSESVRYWHQMVFEPTASQILERGISIFYMDLRFNNVTQASCAHTWLRTVIVPDSRMEEALVERRCRQLETLYPAFIHFGLEDYRAASAHINDRFWQGFLGGIDSALLDQRSARARAAILVALIPVFDSANVKDAIADERIRWIATAQKDPPRRAAAIDVVNAWRLPEDAHRLMVKWIIGS